MESVSGAEAGAVGPEPGRRPELAFDAEAVFDSLTDGVYVVDAEWRLVFMNAAAAHCFHLDRRASLGQSIWTLLPRLQGTEFERQYRRAMAEGEPVQFVSQSAVNPGLFIEVRAFPTRGGLSIIFRDVSDNRQMRDALQKAEERLADVADAMPALISYFDADQIFRFANKAYEARFSRPRSEIVGRPLHEVFGPAMYEARRPYIERALAGEKVTYEVEFIDKDRTLTTSVQHIPDTDQNGKVVGVYSLVNDVTEYKHSIRERSRVEAELRDQTEALKILNETGAAISSSLDLRQVVQAVTDAAVALTGAQFGAFFYNGVSEQGEAMMLYALSGAPASAFAGYPHPRATPVFAPTFRAEGIIRSADITKDSRYGKNAPYKGLPEGHLPVRSYLAVPVVSRWGEAIGGLFFGHAEPDVFTDRAEALIQGLAGQAAIAIDNARLYEAAQAELRKREVVEAALRETDRRLNAVLDNATVAIFLMNERQECIYMNAAAEKLTGFTVADMANRTLHEVIHHSRPDGTPFPVEECAIDRAFPQNRQMQGEETFVHRDGRFIPVAFTASPIHDEAANTVGTIIEVRDITEEKRNERARELLMREVDHRARNALTVVQSVVQLTTAPDIRTFRDTVVGRVQALARAQGSLAERQWHGASLEEVIRGSLGAVASTSSYELQGPELILAPEQVQPVSMVMHELATNARKYGALSSPGGGVTVEWSRGKGGIDLSWRERGGPPVQAPASDGFGSRLIQQLAVQLGAELQVDWRAEGLEVRLIFKAQST